MESLAEAMEANADKTKTKRRNGILISQEKIEEVSRSSYPALHRNYKQ